MVRARRRPSAVSHSIQAPIQLPVARRRGLVLPLVLGLATFIILLGLIGSSVMSSNRRAIVQARARRLARLAAASAIDEACSFLEKRVAFAKPEISDSGDATSRDLGSDPVWQQFSTVPVPVTNAAVSVDGVAVTALHVFTRDWKLETAAVGSRSRRYREWGILQFVATVTVECGRREGGADMVMNRRMTVRRYGWAVPITGQDQLRFKTSTANLLSEESDD